MSEAIFVRPPLQVNTKIHFIYLALSPWTSLFVPIS
jgi:hypothetical protein